MEVRVDNNIKLINLIISLVKKEIFIFFYLTYFLDNPQQLTVIPTNNLPQFLQNNNGVTIRGNNVVQVQFLFTMKI